MQTPHEKVYKIYTIVCYYTPLSINAHESFPARATAVK